MKLYFKKYGKGPSIVILHGFLGTSDNWITITRRLQDRFTVYLVDQRNHGRSFSNKVHTLEVMADDLHELVVDQGMRDPVLIGHSMGGKVVMCYAKRYRDEFDKLVIVDIAPKQYPPHHQELFDALNSIDLKDLQSRTEAEEQIKPMVPDDAIRLFLLKNLDRTREGYRWKANLPVLEKNQLKVGEEVTGSDLSLKPVYFIRGSDSEYVLREDRGAIKRLFPNAKIMTIKNSGHWPHAQQPESFYNTLKVLLET